MDENKKMEEIEDVGTWITKSWVTKNDKVREGRQFDKGRLHRMLTNIAYIGKVRHHDEIYEGEHQAIISEETWNKVQETLADNRRTGGRIARKKHGALLTEILRCGACGAPMIHSYTKKKNKNYRYYVCETAHKNGKQACPTKNVPADEIESFVFERIKEIGSNPELIKGTVSKVKDEFRKRRELLETETKRLRREISGMTTEVKRLREQLTKAEGEKRNEIKRRIFKIDSAVVAKEKALDEKRAAISRIDKDSVCEKDVTEALSTFEPIWDVLYPEEKARIAALIIEKVIYDVPNGEIAVTFRPLGLKDMAKELKVKVGKEDG